MTKKLLFQIIKKLHEVGFNVISIICDMGSSNMGLYKSLNVSIHNTSFLHPITNYDTRVCRCATSAKIGKKPFN